MKTAKYIYGLGLSFVLSGMFLNSCTDANDWGTDASFDRLFGTKQSSFSVTEGAISAEVKWDATPDTEYYILEVSTDSLYDEIPMGAENSIVYGEDGSITKSPYTMTGLLGETTYYLRIKSMSKDKQSNWVYLPDYKFTTDKEQIISEVADTDITDESVVLSWEAGLEVTHITYTQNDVSETRTLTDEEKAAGKVTFSGLLAMTEYVFYIYNGEILRGEQTVTTKEAVMVESQISDVQQTSAVFTWDTSVGRLTGYYFAEGETYPQEANYSLTDQQIAEGKIELTGLEPNTTYTVAIMRDNTVRAMQTFKTEMGIPSTYERVEVSDASGWDTAMGKTGKVAIILKGDIDISNKETIPSNIESLLIYGGDDKNTKTYTLTSKGFKFSGSIETFEIYNVNLKTYPSSTGGHYVIDCKSNADVNINSIYITSCDVSEARGVFRLGSTSAKIKRLIFNDCRFKGIGDYGLYRNDGSAENVENIDLINSTFYPLAANNSLIVDKGTIGVNVKIENVTLYGFTGTIIINKAFNLSISNTLIGGVNGKGKFFGTFSSAVIDKCENVFLTSGNSFESSIGEQVLEYSDDALFEGSTAYNFKVKIDDYKNFGDPYWNK